MREKIEKVYSLKKGDKPQRKRAGKVNEGTVLVEKSSGRKLTALYDGYVVVKDDELVLQGTKLVEKEYKVRPDDDIAVQDGDNVIQGEALTVGSVDPSLLMRLKGLKEAQKYIIDNIQETYGLQGISIDDKHVEIVVRKMASFITIIDPGDSDHLPGDYVNYYEVVEENKELRKAKKNPIKFKRRLLGITAASINTESFLSAASFQEVVRVLSDASLVGKIDKLRGLKENVIIGRPVPLGEYLR